MKKSLMIAAGLAVSLSGCTLMTAEEYSKHDLGVSNKCSFHLMQIATTNNQHLAQISVGMSKQQVFALMGTPAKYESFVLRNDNALEVAFYRTGLRNCALSPTINEMTPLIFKNGTLIGFGLDYYENVIAPAIPKAPKPAPKPKAQPQVQPMPQMMPQQPMMVPMQPYPYGYGYPQGYMPYPMY